MAKSEQANPSTDELRILSELEKKVLWLASWTIHHANHLRENVDGVKVGGHQASSASLAFQIGTKPASVASTNLCWSYFWTES